MAVMIGAMLGGVRIDSHPADGIGGAAGAGLVMVVTVMMMMFCRAHGLTLALAVLCYIPLGGI
jgi:hypothetical protein